MLLSYPWRCRCRWARPGLGALAGAKNYREAGDRVTDLRQELVTLVGRGAVTPRCGGWRRVRSSRRPRMRSWLR